MPELPEVQTIAKDMNTYLPGYLIEKVKIKGTYRITPSREIFVNGIEGKTSHQDSSLLTF